MEPTLTSLTHLSEHGFDKLAALCQDFDCDPDVWQDVNGFEDWECGAFILNQWVAA